MEHSNKVHLVGRVLEEFSRVGKYYTTFIGVPRLSDEVDVVEIVVSDEICDVTADWSGNYIEVSGRIYSRNIRMENGKNRLRFNVFVERANGVPDIDRMSRRHTNSVALRGVVCRPPKLRETPMGHKITDLMLAVNREAGNPDYIPCLVWNKLAYLASQYEVGTECELFGRIESREYTKRLDDGSTITRTVWEVSASRIFVV